MSSFIFFCDNKYSPSLFSSVKMKQGNKSDLLGCLETKKDSAVANTPSVEVTVSRKVQLLCISSNWESNRQTTYSSNMCFRNWEKTQRMDIVWDVYVKDSLKLSSRGTRTQKRMANHAKLPGSSKTLLRKYDN